MENKEWYFTPNNMIEVKDPSREACIITIGKNNQEKFREYFGRNARVVVNKDYDYDGKD
tara:strand:+ start:730 stop:906 length:177 start_codon:yes stop_codon:yes gene_type:complete